MTTILSSFCDRLMLANISKASVVKVKKNFFFLNGGAFGDGC